MCLDHSAHGVVSTHEIFRKPYEVALQWETITTPDNYRKYWNGRDLGPTMKAWRVQETGYVDDDSMSPGVVAGSWGFTDSPDAEFIAGGVNTKGPNYVAIGRHGPFFQWGFEASPKRMTASARYAFINASCYISRFDGQAPLTRKSFIHRGRALDTSLRLRNVKKAYEGLVQFYADRKKIRARAEAKQRAGEELTDAEKTELQFRPMDAPPFEQYRDGLFRSFPQSIVEKFGKDEAGLQKYLPYYEENIEFVWYDGKHYVVDEDAKALGISNRDTAILERAIGDLENGKDVERARRILTRYTDRTFSDARQWRTWFDAEGGELFFSDIDGYRFHSARPSSAALRKAARAGTTLEPTDERPVAWSCSVIGDVKPGATVTIAVRMNIADAWHAYDQVPDNSPYPTTALTLSLPKGVKAVGEWDRPLGHPYPDDPRMTVYKGDIVFLHRARISHDFVTGTYGVRVSYQVCDPHRCLPPSVKNLTGAFGTRPGSEPR